MQHERDNKAVEGLNELRDGYVFLLANVALSAVLGFVPVVGHSVIGLLSILGILKILEGFRLLSESKLANSAQYSASYFWLKSALVEFACAVVVFIIAVLVLILTAGSAMQLFSSMSMLVLILTVVTILFFVIGCGGYIVGLLNLASDTGQKLFYFGAIFTVITIIIQIGFVADVMHGILGIAISVNETLSGAVFQALYGLFNVLVSLILFYVLVLICELVTLFVCYRACYQAAHSFPSPVTRRRSKIMM